jgi:hypothetical protein
MAKHADKAVPGSPEEWLDEFSTFSIYEILPQIIDLRGINIEQQVASKKQQTTEQEMITPLFLLALRYLWWVAYLHPLEGVAFKR